MNPDSKAGYVVRYIEENYFHPLHVTDLANCVGLSPSRLEHMLREEFGFSFRNKIQELRLTKAEALLAEMNLEVKEIVFQCGYTSVPTFCRNFKKRFGCTPKQYRQQVGIMNSRSG